MPASNLGAAIPLYVTRKDADGETGTWSVSFWVPALAFALTWLNVVGWAVYGLVELISKVV